MNKWLKRLSNWFFQIENEVMIPFVLVGILVIGSFSVISYYNGYTMQKNSELELADTLFEDVNRDLHFLEKRLPEEEIAEKYRNFERGRIRILDRDGEEITAGTRWENTSVLAVSKGTIHLAGGWSTGWMREYSGTHLRAAELSGSRRDRVADSHLPGKHFHFPQYHAPHPPDEPYL